MDKGIFQAYEDEIQALEEEIRLLTEKYEDMQQESTFFSDEEILKLINSFQRETQGETKGHESLSDLKAQLESLEADLLFLTEFTGFHFTSHSKKTVEKTQDGTVQKHRLSGKCHSLSFQLEFQLLEMQNNEKVSAVVSDLRIIMESTKDSNVSKFLSRTEERGDLLTFFRSLSTYAEWYEHRRHTFLHFKAVWTRISLFHILHDSLRELPRYLEGKNIMTFTDSIPCVTRANFTQLDSINPVLYYNSHFSKATKSLVLWAL
ncbi:centromere protein P isoform X2 [Anomalospiza imberbis]|uniref:centromere protein P isoform X2 n=1 Tax=Anomalospiza imberbis TaxID=187417 RepID=UPI00358F75BA